MSLLSFISPFRSRKTTVMKSTPKVAIVDDHALFCKGLTMLLEGIGYPVLFQHGSGRELQLGLSEENLPDLVLLDIDLPGEDAYHTTVWLREQHPSVKVVAMGMYINEKDITRIITSGARDYILKTIDPYELKQRLKKLLL